MTAAPGRMEDGGRASPSDAKNLIAGVTIGALTLLTQIVLRRELAPGEFGTLNALFGVTLVIVVPLAALGFILRRALPPAAVGPLLNRAGPSWGILCLVILFVGLPALHLPRLSLQFYMLLAVGAGLFAVCGRPATAARWCAMLGISAAVMRLLVSAWCGADWPVAESGLGALVLGSTLAGLPALRDQPVPPPLATVWRALRPLLVPALATLSLACALALFTNADRIAAQTAFIARNAGTDEFIDYSRFDEYQAAGMLARYVLWGLLPLLMIFRPKRDALTKTTYASLRWLWIYLGALLFASIVLAFSGGLEQLLFGGRPDVFLPGFAGAVFLLGLVQAIGVFALASRRHVECFVLAACSIGYTAVFFIVNNPFLLTSCMTGGALVSLALVLIVGVVRYARSHP